MTIDEIKRLLAMAAARDNRTPSQAMALAWQRDLDGLELAECVEAMDRHFKNATDQYLKPGHIQALVRIIRDEKRKGATVAAIAAVEPYRDLAAEERAEYVARRAAACLEAAGVNRAAANRVRDNDDPVRDRALARAATEKRQRERVTRNPALAGLVAKATAHIEQRS